MSFDPLHQRDPNQLDLLNPPIVDFVAIDEGPQEREIRAIEMVVRSSAWTTDRGVFQVRVRSRDGVGGQMEVESDRSSITLLAGPGPGAIRVDRSLARNYSIWKSSVLSCVYERVED